MTYGSVAMCMETAIIYPTESSGYGIIGIIYMINNIHTSIRNY